MIFIIIAILIAIIINAYYIKRNGMYKYAKNHIVSYTFLFLFLFLILFFVSGWKHFSEGETWIGYLDNIISDYILVGAVFLCYNLEKIIKNFYEDKEKLTQDYIGLTKRYSKEKMISNNQLVYPEVDLGMCDICLYSVNSEESIDKIEIQDNALSFYNLPGILENNFIDIIQVHDSSTTYNNINIRVRDMEIKSGKLSMITERTYYYYSLVTNRAADYKWNQDGVSVRELLEPGPFITPLKQSALSNHLGFNGFIISKDGYIVFVYRKKDTSIGKRTYGDSIGASLKTKYALDSNGSFSKEGLRDAILGEIHDELRIKTSDVTSIKIISAYRDLVECGKPQLLFYSEIDLCAKDIDSIFKTGSLADNGLEKTPEAKMVVDGERLVWLHKSDFENIVFDINGIKCISDKGFFTYDNNCIEKRLDNQYLRMVPSASACVLLFLKNQGIDR